MKKQRLVWVLLLVCTVSFAQDLDGFLRKTDAFMKTYVKDGKVAYSKIHDAPQTLNALMEQAKTIVVPKAEAKQYQAFWINTYNLTVIKGIIDHYPTNSPLDTPGFFDKITYMLGGKKLTLNAIENDLLRAQFGDPRFHFVLVCGAIGCPPLISKVYMPETLDAQMDTQTRLAINGSFLKLNTKKKRVQVSQIMQWYKPDFKKKGMKEIDFINKYRSEKIPPKFKLSYFPYDWSLNKQ